jgi:hypothetical protein
MDKVDELAVRWKGDPEASRRIHELYQLSLAAVNKLAEKDEDAQTMYLTDNQFQDVSKLEQWLTRSPATIASHVKYQPLGNTASACGTH